MYYTCHNCNKSYTIQNFLKLVDHNLYTQYKIESYKERNNIIEEKVPDYSAAKSKPVFEHKINLPKVSELPNDHIARQYVMNRSIPKFHWDRLYYAEDFLAFCDDMYPEHGKKLPRDDMRLVIPFWDQKKILQGVQGRTLSNSEIRYITCKAFPDAAKVYGLDLVKTTETIYVTEGIIDSFFLPNSLASLDANLYGVTKYVPAEMCVFIPDRDVRNKEVMRTTERLINKNVKVCLLPEGFPGKDINEAILSGMTSDDIFNIVKSHTYEGLRAKLEFSRWKKI
jgi:hypothetical protein